ncbi:malonyl-ACP O-methyltransferase BioC [Acinetobacter piscicola]|uniref:malonyl-ACP O-methyltransferase BioC n=1 Tax=Acinetobacter piscicola TaxID=2006115 RepID=UPI000B7F0E0C|nr:malonyl-ACP O-methyltransferase BioC [Acinetobacter piscicola]
MNIDKSQVALRFAQAGQSYNQHAVVQKQIAQQLFDLIRKFYPKTHAKSVFEIGCGSGNLTYPLMQNLQIQHLILNDLYVQVQQHFQTDQKLEWLIGDIEQLEFPQHLDLIVSSSALQWMHDLDMVFQKSHASLNRDGYLCFSTFGQKNLQEIKALTGQGLAYLSIENIQEKLRNSGFEVLYLSEQVEHLNFQYPKQVLQHLKATGVTATASNFRWTKQTLQDFYLNYQKIMHQNESGEKFYSLTYHPIYCIARRLP